MHVPISFISHVLVFVLSGDVFVKKNVSQQKIKKVKRMADKVLGWG